MEVIRPPKLGGTWVVTTAVGTSNPTCKLQEFLPRHRHNKMSFPVKVKLFSNASP
jgi:hypothetical protein